MKGERDLAPPEKKSWRRHWPYVYLGIEPYIVCVFKLICSVYVFARFA